MIVDCHTQIWESNAPIWATRLTPASANETIQADAVRHLAAAGPVDHSIVLGFKSRYLEAEIPNRYVAEYVKKNPSKMVGFAGIDPTDPEWPAELEQAQQEFRLKGVTVSPSMQDFHPCDTRAMEVYEQCANRGMPILFQQNHRNPAEKMEYSQPIMLDAVAREFPELRIVIAHMGYPAVDETVVLLGKHKHLYAEISGLLDFRWTSYNALLTAYQFGVMDKLLFGSDFPFKAPAACIEALYSINQVSQGTNLTAIPREHLRGIVERDALTLLGIAAPQRPSQASTTIIADDD